MTHPRWSAVERLYLAAASRDVAERAAFLADACDGDHALRREVESLLAQEPNAEGFLSAPAIALGIADTGSSFIGRQLGAYTIDAPLGAGGMGEVYRAHDGTLGRDVAIKILPRAFTQDHDRLARFEREARILASLNHPHIGAIYGLENADGVLALVLELVEGATLAERLATGPLPIAESVAIARQIAEAVAAAHEKGIVHRDLKPANIKITSAGVVKVLDFGLARADPALESADLARSPTRLVAETSEGMLLGTAPYMSPEQARGKLADKRTDIWAFGCVLYEMLTGRAPFTGDTLSDTLAAILEREPDWGGLPEATSEPIRRLLRRCLQKDPGRRVHDIADARLDLDDAESLSAPALGDVRVNRNRSSARERTAWTLVGLMSLAALSLAVFLFYRPASVAAIWTFTIPPPENGAFSRESNGQMLAVSPDGRTIAFLAAAPGGKRAIWLRLRDDLTANVLVGTEGAQGLFWKPDSQSVGFYASGKLKSVSVVGGASQTTICDAPGSIPFHATWNQAGDILFVAETRGVGGLRHVSASGGTPTVETTIDRAHGETGHLWPYFLPDGQHFLYVVTAEDGGGIYVGSLGANRGRRLWSFDKKDGVSSLAYAAPGYVLYVLGSTLMAQRFNAARLQPTGEAARVADGVLNTGAGGGGAFSVSANGVLAYWSGGDVATSRLAWFARDGGETRTALPPKDYRRVSLEPNGARVAVELVGVSGSPAIFLLDLIQGSSQPFTSDRFSIWPVWSADGTSIIFSSMRDGALAPYRQLVNAREDAQRLFTSTAPTTVTDLSTDGETALYQTGNYPNDEIGVFSLAAGGTPRLFIHTPGGVSDGHLSSDRRWMAYVSSNEVFVTSFPEGTGKWQISSNGGSQPRWRGDGTELYYLSSSRKVMTVKVTLTPTFQHDPPIALFDVSTNNYAVTSDGRRFLLVIPTGDKPASPPIRVVVNWTMTLAR